MEFLLVWSVAMILGINAINEEIGHQPKIQQKEFRLDESTTNHVYYKSIPYRVKTTKTIVLD
jgi:hypothetical protein